MRVDVNGQQRELADGTSLTALLDDVIGPDGSTRGTAVVVDDEVVPRGAWPRYALRDGQRVELITAVQGG